MDYQSVLTTCPYCAVGCNLVLQVLDGQIIGTLPAKTGPSNEGSLCIKGWNVHEFVQHQDRLTKPHDPPERGPWKKSPGMRPWIEAAAELTPDQRYLWARERRLYGLGPVHQ